MRWGCFVILSVLLVTKAAASCNREACEIGLSVGVGVTSVCSTAGAFLCAVTIGLGCVVSLACGVAAGVAGGAKEACRSCGDGGDGAGVLAEGLSLQMNNLSVTVENILNLTLKLEGQIQLTQIIGLYGQDINNYLKVKRAFNRLSKNAQGLVISNLDQESFEKAANSAIDGAAASYMLIFKMMTGGHPLKAETIFQAVPETCRDKDYFVKVMIDCNLLESVARAMRGESMNPTRVLEYKKQLILVEDQFIKDCGCPEGLVKTSRQSGLQPALASLARSLPSGNCSSQVTYTDRVAWHGQCVTEIGHGRLLPHHGQTSNRMTPFKCIAFCKLDGFLLAGVRYEKDCWCGNTPPPNSSLTPESECNMPCPGDSSVACGQAWRMNVYSTGHCSSPVTYPGQPVLSFIMDNLADRNTLKKITLLYSAIPFSPAKAAAAKAISDTYSIEELNLAKYLSMSGTLSDLTLFDGHLFCAKPAFCPLGYTFHNGSGPGWGSILGQSLYLDQSITDCKGLCGSHTECCSFQWSPTSRTCYLNKECKPSGESYQDYRYCEQNYRVVWHGQCVKEKRQLHHGRLLPNYDGNSDDMTPFNCIVSCKKHGHLLAGVQNKKECWCGNTPPPNSALTLESECNMPCPGDSSVACGRAWRMNVYSTGGTLVLSNGPKCETEGRGSVKESECLDVAKSHGYSVANGTQTGSWTWAPYGCFVGAPKNNSDYAYFNSISGRTGRSAFRTFCTEHQVDTS